MGVRRPPQRRLHAPFSWTSIVRHQTVWQRASPDDPTLADYWARRRRKSVLPINNTSLWLLKAQDGCCPICKTPLFADQPQTPSDWETVADGHPHDDHDRQAGDRHDGRG